MSRMSVEELRAKIAANGWGTIDLPPPQPLGQSASLTKDQVVNKLASRVGCLKRAARLIATDEDLSRLFQKFLAKELGDEDE